MLKNKRQIYVHESINEALKLSMLKDKKVVILGLGVDDPKGIFGTTKKLSKIFKKNRIFEFPTAENAMTGIAIGSSLMGFKPVITHQRVEFSLLSIEQIINQAAKWYFMTGGKKSVPMVIRLIIGRGWGQGPQHAQSLETLFAHIPGLKVVSISSPYNAKGLLISAIEDPNPVILFEHRWVHELKGDVPKKLYKCKLDRALIALKGRDITLISSSYMLVECLRSAQILKQNSISVEVVDIQCLRPLDKTTIVNSVKKTKNALIVDNGGITYGISAEIISSIYDNLNSKEKKEINIKRIGLSDNPIPSSKYLAKYCYPDFKDIITNILLLLNKKIKINYNEFKNVPSDQPNKKFMGPF